MEIRAEGLWPAQDTLQSVCTMEPSGDLSQDLLRVVATVRDQRRSHNRRHPSEGPPNGSESPEKWAVPRCIGRTKGGLNSKFHAVGDDAGKPVHLLLTAWHTSDDTGARCLLPVFPMPNI